MPVSTFIDIDWLGMHLSVPADWEIAGHSVLAKNGKLMLVDRYVHRMQISWIRCTRKPDIRRLFDDFESRDRKEHPQCTIDRGFSMNRWAGYRRMTDSAVLTRAGLFDAANARWIDVAIPWHGVLNEELEHALLSAFRVSDLNALSQRWRAFNVDVESPPCWVLGAAEIRPGDVQLTFNKKNVAFSVHKVGMAGTWFSGDIIGFLRTQAGPLRGAYSEQGRGPHAGGIFDGRERRFHPGWLWGKRLVCHAHAWHCAASNAVYHLSTIRCSRQAGLHEDFRVRCCDTTITEKT
jgi:hypothetical protein